MSVPGFFSWSRVEWKCWGSVVLGRIGRGFCHQPLGGSPVPVKVALLEAWSCVPPGEAVPERLVRPRASLYGQTLSRCSMVQS